MKKVLTIIAFVFLGILAVITLFPFVYMILAGLMSYSEATSMPPTMFPKTTTMAKLHRGLSKSTLSSVFLEHSLCFRRYNDCYGSHRRVSFIRINEFEVPF